MSSSSNHRSINRDVVLWSSFVLIIGIAITNLHFGLNYERNFECRIERCSQECIPADINKLKQILSSKIFGQTNAVTKVISLIEDHFARLEGSQQQHSLFLHFTGSPGIGKRYMAELIAQSLYKYGLSSRYVFDNATSDFKMDCTRSFFIYEEPPSFDKNFGDSIVIFISNSNFITHSEAIVHEINFRPLNIWDVKKCLDADYEGLSDGAKQNILSSLVVNGDGFVQNGCKSVIKRFQSSREEL